MKKILLFTLFLAFLVTVRLDAQVTIGDNSAPHPGAILDLKSTKGLKLPTVAILDVNVFQLSADLLNEATGMMVYNTNDATADGQGKGVYVWDGGKWLFMTAVPTVPVASVSITAQDGTLPEILHSGSTLQLKANVLPAAVANKSVTWSIVDGDAAEVSNTGLVTGTGNGDVVIRATSNADNSKRADYPLTIIESQSGAGTVTGDNGTYTTWCFTGTPGNICWMTQNSMEGSYASIGSGSYTGRGFYYQWSNAGSACPTGWTLPNQTQWDALKSYLNGSPDATFKTAWYAYALAGGYMNIWYYWNVEGFWWSDTVYGQFYDTDGSIIQGPDTDDVNYYYSVRCVKIN